MYSFTLLLFGLLFILIISILVYYGLLTTFLEKFNEITGDNNMQATNDDMWANNSDIHATNDDGKDTAGTDPNVEHATTPKVTAASNNLDLDDPQVISNYKLKRKHLKSNGEILCCKIFEDFLGYEVIINSKPAFLINPRTGNRLELDFFDPFTNIAIEYNGMQHYVDGGLHTTSESFVQQKYRDKIKMELASKHNIYLITVPFYEDNYKIVNDKYVKISKITMNEREIKLKAYLLPILKSIKEIQSKEP